MQIFYSYKTEINEFNQYKKIANINKNRTCWFCQCDCKEFVAICNDCKMKNIKKSKSKIKNDIYKNNN